MLSLVYLSLLAGLFALVFNLHTVLDVVRQAIEHLVPRQRVRRRVARAH